jgi:hypothetical protein
MNKQTLNHYASSMTTCYTRVRSILSTRSMPV